MEGVQFLLRDPVYITEYSWGFSWEGLLYIVIAIVLFIYFIVAFKRNRYGDFLFGMLFTILYALISLIAFSIGTETEVYSHSEYQVTISDDVKLKEFMENYEIVDVKGEIYTIVIKSELEGTKEIA